MKKFSFVFIIALIALSCNEKKEEALKNIDTLADNLKGKVEQTIDTDYKVDSSGKMGEQDSCCVVTTGYDDKGYISRYASDNKAATEKTKEEYVHYDNGTMKSVNSTRNGKQVSKISIDIDKDGKYTTAKSFDSTGKMDSYYTDIASNDYGQLTSFKQYKPDSTLKMSMQSNYDSQFFMSNSVKDSIEKETYSSSLKRDGKNNITERKTMNVGKDSTTNKVLKYTYDSEDDKGNWTQRTELDENGKPVKITKRTITYYKE